MHASVERLLEALRVDGFGKLGGLVNESIVERMNLAAARLCTGESDSWDGAAKWFADAAWKPTYFAGDGKNTNLYDCLGLDPSLDAAAEELIATPEIRTLLDTVLGDDYRLWYAQLRWAHTVPAPHCDGPSGNAGREFHVWYI